MNTLLVPIDFSTGTKGLVAEAANLAAALKARLVLLHVIEPLPAAASEPQFLEAATRLAAETEGAIEQELFRLQRELQVRDITAATFHVTGIPGPSIIAQARDFAATYIVMGSHGHGTLYELIVGSTTGRVLKEAPCPVIIVPTAAAPAGPPMPPLEAMQV